MNDKNIICPICDEDLGHSIDEIPEKCPICDTRKYEILQELEDEKGQGAPGGIMRAGMTPFITPITSPSSESPQVEEESQVVIEEEIGKESDEEDVDFTDTPVSEEIIFSDHSEEDVLFDDEPLGEIEEKSEIAMDPENATSLSTPIPKTRHRRIKSGASSLEILLRKGEKISPGHYLVLYNAEKKAISYFRINDAGSIIIGRSSERNSPQDIDITRAWKHYYENLEDEKKSFRNKMEMLKGISRKHGLIRYLAEENKYVLFHLSDKNYTVVQLPGGDRRERAPQNRSRIDLVADSIISMGNQKSFIILRYKVIRNDN